MFETRGFNIQSEYPELTLVARIGDGHYPWNSWQLWVRDLPLFLIAIPTMGAVISCPRVNNVELLVYDYSGKRIADYTSEKSYYALSIAFPFANFANSKDYSWYGDRKSTEFALIDCVNQFFMDLQVGKFKEAIQSAKEKHVLKSLSA